MIKNGLNAGEARTVLALCYFLKKNKKRKTADGPKRLVLHFSTERLHNLTQLNKLCLPERLCCEVKRQLTALQHFLTGFKER